MSMGFIFYLLKCPLLFVSGGECLEGLKNLKEAYLNHPKSVRIRNFNKFFEGN